MTVNLHNQNSCKIPWLSDVKQFLNYIFGVFDAIYSIDVIYNAVGKVISLHTKACEKSPVVIRITDYSNSWVFTALALHRFSAKF